MNRVSAWTAAATAAWTNGIAAGEPLGSSCLMLPIAAAMREEPAAEEKAFGDAGSKYWTILAGVAYHHDSTDASVYGGLGFFLADTFEFNIGLGGWWYWQEGDDTGGVNPALGFRYHFMPKDPFNVYLDVGIGLLFTGDDVPDDGESVNFTPRAGIGTLWRLGESVNSPRLDLGVRWQHVSTASTTGSDDNPSRDSIMVYAGIVIPF
jgi:hypothetical protein